ncbi:MAG: hypothetical protein E6R03_16370 [Hyphomicrobiaceae bacterium]|nr:MAG: hypothetical protein E6R03_16370 [Hyphomicrobiaceae bacterium]
MAQLEVLLNERFKGVLMDVAAISRPWGEVLQRALAPTTDDLERVRLLSVLSDRIERTGYENLASQVRVVTRTVTSLMSEVFLNAKVKDDRGDEVQ